MKPNLLAYGFLLIAILFEVCGTNLLQTSAQFTRLWPSIGVVACYGASFYFLSLTSPLALPTRSGVASASS